MKFFKKLRKKINLKNENIITVIFFITLFAYLIIVMRNAFSIDFFLDDFFFLKVGKARGVVEFIKFFSPIKTYFYRPIPTEVFYFIINSFKQNLLIAHSIVFIFYFVGLVFLFKISNVLFKSKLFSYIFVFIYAISFTHVFQLYELATFIEIALFTFLVLSFYFYIKKKYMLSVVFFIFALMSKETSVLFPVLLLIYELFTFNKINKEKILRLMLFFVISFLFTLIYKHATSQVLVLDTYKITLSPKLIINNSLWYLLWALGIPNFVPNYVQSILFKPTSDFWNLFSDTQIRYYFYILILFYSLLIPMFLIVVYKAKNKRAKLIGGITLLVILFFVFISPTIPIVHRWIVRLTVPVIFTSMIYAAIIYLGYKRDGFLKYLSIVILCLYFIMSTLGIKIHESSGLFLMDSQTIKNFRVYLAQNKNMMKKFDNIYFVSSSKGNYGGSVELKNMLGSYYFEDTLIPNQHKNVFYGHEYKYIPLHSFVIESKDIAQW